MLQKRNDLEIIEFLRKEKSHIRKIAAGLKQTPSTIYRILKRFEKEKVVDFNQQGKNKIYFLKSTIESKIYLKLAEDYKFLKLVQRPFIKEIIKEILNLINDELIVLFGSYAKNLEKKSSDIDIYIETKDKKLKAKIMEINNKINLKIGDFDKSAFLAKEIIKNHIIIQNSDRFYKLIK